MIIQYNPDDDIAGGVYGMGKYHGPVSASKYKKEVHPENNPKSNLNNHSTKCRLLQRIRRKFKDKLAILSSNEDITISD